jgi:hypothetical protein
VDWSGVAYVGRVAKDDTITGHEVHAVSRGAPHRVEIWAFQAECRGFETRLPLQILASQECSDTQPGSTGRVRRQTRSSCDRRPRSGSRFFAGISRTTSVSACPKRPDAVGNEGDGHEDEANKQHLDGAGPADSVLVANCGSMAKKEGRRLGIGESHDQNGLPSTLSGVELRPLRKMPTLGEARLAAAMTATPEPVARIAERAGMEIHRAGPVREPTAARE